MLLVRSLATYLDQRGSKKDGQNKKNLHKCNRYYRCLALARFVGRIKLSCTRLSAYQCHEAWRRI